MNAQGRASRIYVELDVLLDTRLGTLNLMDENKAKMILASGEYHTRKSDEFEGVDMALYRALYEKRDIEVLKKSVITEAIFQLKMATDALLDQAITKPLHDRVVVDINMFPFVLDTETTEAIILAVKARLNPIIEVCFINLPPSGMTPTLCDELYSLMMMYNVEHWLEAQAKAFETKSIPTITLFAPAIYLCKKPDDEFVNFDDGGKIHLLAALEAGVAPFVELVLLDVKVFSIVNFS